MSDHISRAPEGRSQHNEHMSWPPDVHIRHVPELDGFRGAVAAVFDGDSLVMHIVCEVEPHYMRAGGHLWWRRWTGKEIVHGYECHADWATDWVSDPDHPVSAVFLRDLLDGWYRERNYDATDYSLGQQAPVVTEYRVLWLDEPERSRVLRDNGF